MKTRAMMIHRQKRKALHEQKRRKEHKLMHVMSDVAFAIRKLQLRKKQREQGKRHAESKRTT